MHQATHQVKQETVHSGPWSEKRTSEVDCVDGNCQKSMSIMGPGPAAFALGGLVPLSIHNHMPCMKAVWQRLADAQQQLPEMRPMLVRVKFLRPRAPPVAVITDEELEASPPPTVDQSQALFLTSACIMAAVGVTFAAIMGCRLMCAGKAQARETPLQALGEPLFQDMPSEMFLATEVNPSSAVKPSATPTQVYLKDFYARVAAPTTVAEVVTIYLGHLYKQASSEAVSV